MSTGAVFKLVANDGKADRMIMATALLNQRIKDVMCARAAAGKEDPTPTLTDLEKTHILFVNAHFKPYAAVGFEYNKVRPNTGAPQLGGRMTFSIPQFGDFFHDMVLRVRLGTCSAASNPLPVSGGPFVPVQAVAGVNNAPNGVSTGATAAAVAMNTAGDNNWKFDPNSNDPLTTGLQAPTTAQKLITVLAAAGTTYDQATINFIIQAAAIYWSSAAITTNVVGVTAIVGRAAALTFVNVMFGVALSNLNPSFQALLAFQTAGNLAAAQLQFNNIAAGAVAGLFKGFMDQILAQSTLNTPTVSRADGNSFLGYLYDVINQTTGTTWSVPDFSNYALVDAFGACIESPILTTSPGSYRNLVRYCEFPGNRLISSVRFDVNNNPLDTYTQNVTVMLEKFAVPTDKRTGYNRLTGQAVPLQGMSGPKRSTVTDADAANTPLGIGRWFPGQSNSTVALFTTNAVNNPASYVGGSLIDPAIPAPASLNQYAPAQYDISQRQTAILNGAQTPKPVQPPLELWHKLKFWFCDDVRQSIPSVSIPFGQRFISVDLATANNLAYEFPSLYVQSTLIAPKLTISDNQLVIASEKTVTYTPVNQFAGVTAPVIEAADLYINNIFVNPEIHDIYIKRVGFSLIRVYREQSTPVSTSGTHRELLSQLKWPIEFMFVGIQPGWNTLNPTSNGLGVVSGNTNTWRDWHRMTRQVDADDSEFCESLSTLTASSTTVAFTNGASTTLDVQTNGDLGGDFNYHPFSYLANVQVYSCPIFDQAGVLVLGGGILLGTVQNATGFVLISNEVIEPLVASASMQGELCVIDMLTLAGQAVLRTLMPIGQLISVESNNILTNTSLTTQGFNTLNSHLSVANSSSGSNSYNPATLLGSKIGQVIPDRYWLPVPTVDAMSLIAHGITIFDDFQDGFYNQYMPYHYGSGQVVTPEDPGAFFVNMALYPRAYQPSGHLNVSRARETYLGWNSSYIGTNTASLMIVVAVAINFLLVSDGSAVLRYST